jgi:hypothetical protein
LAQAFLLIDPMYDARLYEVEDNAEVSPIAIAGIWLTRHIYLAYIGGFDPTLSAAGHKGAMSPGQLEAAREALVLGRERCTSPPEFRALIISHMPWFDAPRR